MRIVIKDGVEMAELSPTEYASLDARIASLDSGKSRTFTEEEIDEIWRREDLADEQNSKGKAA